MIHSHLLLWTPCLLFAYVPLLAVVVLVGPGNPTLVTLGVTSGPGLQGTRGGGVGQLRTQRRQDLFVLRRPLK